MKRGREGKEPDERETDPVPFIRLNNKHHDRIPTHTERGKQKERKIDEDEKQKKRQKEERRRRKKERSAYLSLAWWRLAAQAIAPAIFSKP
jgi:hypothetical protein